MSSPKQSEVRKVFETDPKIKYPLNEAALIGNH